MWTVVEKEGKYAHVEAPLVKKVYVTYDSWSQGNCASYSQTVEDSCDHDASPGRAISSNYVGNCGQQACGDDDGPSAIGVCERDDKKRPASREEQVYGEFVRGLNWCDAECSPQGHECRVDDS